MADRTARRLDEGGGPGTWFGVFTPIHPAMLGEAEMLQVGAGNAGHQRMSVQARPGPPLEVPETEFLFELLMCLLADPARLDGGCQGLQ
jgi:hypothetical protein